MQIFVRAGHLHLVEVDPSLSVAELKTLVEAREGACLAQAYAVCGGRVLDDGASLVAEGLANEQTVDLCARLLGGGKKRKKKTYTKPKKLKHKHKKVKLRVLSYYKVDDSGKVHRILRQCPNCGAGTFMANHFDRVYCGKCALTFLYKQDQEQAAAS